MLDPTDGAVPYTDDAYTNDAYTNDDPELLEAYHRGRKAARRGEDIPDDPVYESDEKQAAWLNGYLRAQTPRDMDPPASNSSLDLPARSERPSASGDEPFPE